MSGSTIPSGCLDRRLFLGLERDARLLIEVAAADDPVQLWPLVGFLLVQNVRLEHEELCPICREATAA